MPMRVLLVTMRKSVLMVLIIRVIEKIYTNAMQNHLLCRAWLIPASVLPRRLMKSDSSRKKRILRDTTADTLSAVTFLMKR